jgi:hypothetical protein
MARGYHQPALNKEVVIPLILGQLQIQAGFQSLFGRIVLAFTDALQLRVTKADGAAETTVFNPLSPVTCPFVPRTHGEDFPSHAVMTAILSFSVGRLKITMHEDLVALLRSTSIPVGKGAGKGSEKDCTLLHLRGGWTMVQ